MKLKTRVFELGSGGIHELNPLRPSHGNISMPELPGKGGPAHHRGVSNDINDN